MYKKKLLLLLNFFIVCSIFSIHSFFSWNTKKLVKPLSKSTYKISCLCRLSHDTWINVSWFVEFINDIFITLPASTIIFGTLKSDGALWVLIYDLVGFALLTTCCNGVHNIVYSVGDCTFSSVVTLYKVVSMQVVVHKIASSRAHCWKKKGKRRQHETLSTTRRNICFV